MYKVAILTIGDEILIGQTVNTNSAYIGEKLTAIGAKVDFAVTIPDDEKYIKDYLEICSENYNLTIITGGLGPTKDDITKKVLCDFFDSELYTDKEIVEKIEELAIRRSRKVNPLSLMMANLPVKCIKLKNDVGVAPGMLFSRNSNKLISLPGVPNEMKSILNNEVIPIVIKEIIDKNFAVQIYKTFYTFGIPESELALKIETIENELSDFSIAYLPSYSGVKLRLGLSSTNKLDAESKFEFANLKISKLLENNLASDGQKDIMQDLQEYLISKNLTVSCAESCTAGLLAAKLTELSGSSQFFEGGIVSYSNNVKESLLNVSQDSLNKFGAVSEEVAKEMSENCRKKFDTDFALSITGVAGPTGGSEEKPVGCVFISCSSRNKTIVKKYIFAKDRTMNRELSVSAAIQLLYQMSKSQI